MLKPGRKPQKIYPNADRYGEDGRRLYSAYDGAAVARRPGRQLWVKRFRLVAIVLAFIAGALAAIIISALPH
ncbi:MAG: hypothetical protein E5V92_01920 [Mesorhizobium sp.]|uniref:hypothetical protein n=1 Tax=unclassified Mesorhizobium TaxID=325217 RepID=UPI000F760EE7|nr:MULTISPECIES: hypothetical protein [unclassified Mesorhizobium]AZO75028.1 hypothetical protein EJ067_30540 [Mesorhizobium sp. M1D.F.Ca.ET.043.01.1.1]RWA96101.1 MAG: hypothetical protein EOQ32_00335 [Mesorhizobium sp.]TJW90381.1 MAG: hypothetical protein E5V92_01920 [Mesorhizobium sp.]